MANTNQIGNLLEKGRKREVIERRRNLTNLAG